MRAAGRLAGRPHPVRVATRNPITGRKPQMPFAVIQHGVNAGLLQPAMHLREKSLPVPQVPSAVLGPNQQRPALQRQQRRHHVAREPVHRRVVGDRAAMQPRQSSQRSHPQVSVGIASHRAHQVAAEATGLRIGLHLRAGKPGVRSAVSTLVRACPVHKAAPGSDPKRPIRIHQQRSDEVVRQSVGGSKRIHRAAANSIQPIRRANPKIAIWCSGQRQNHVAQQPVTHRECAHCVGQACTPTHGIQAAPAGPDPQLASRALHHGGGSVGTQPLTCPDGTEALIAQNVQPARLRPHP